MRDFIWVGTIVGIAFYFISFSLFSSHQPSQSGRGEFINCQLPYFFKVDFIEKFKIKNMK
jgi:hypothetical protein